jgi:hypothetical protein
MQEYGVYYDGVYHFFRDKDRADEFVKSIPLDRRNRCIKLYV